MRDVLSTVTVCKVLYNLISVKKKILMFKLSFFVELFDKNMKIVPKPITLTIILS